MKDSSSESQGTEAWYTYDGQDNDVIVATRVRLARNLADFPFPEHLRPGDDERIISIVFDAFNQMSDGESFQAITMDKLDTLGWRILHERGALDVHGSKKEGLILRNDGKLSCTVNSGDHVQIKAFATGLDLDQTVRMVTAVDSGLQSKIQFAASYDFGYLTANTWDAGSGMKISLRMHLPSVSAMGGIRSLASMVMSEGFSFTATYGNGGYNNVDGSGGKGSSLGSYYTLDTVNCLSGTELDQMSAVVSMAAKIKDMERTSRDEYKKNTPSNVKNYMYRAVALARSSMFVSLREAISIISGVKWGKDMGFLTGIDDTELHALLYRIQEGHLEYVLKNGIFHFEKDVKDVPQKKNERLRALILQEAFQDIKLAL